jgi:hypothetical protein
MRPIIEEEIKETFARFRENEPARCVGFLDGLQAAGEINGEQRDELIEANHSLRECVSASLPRGL